MGNILNLKLFKPNHVVWVPRPNQTVKVKVKTSENGSNQ